MFAGVLIGLSALKGFFQYWMRVIIIGISRDIEFDLRNDLFAHLVALSGDFYGKYRTGDIMARATNDLNAVRMMLGPGIMYWTETMLTLILADRRHGLGGLAAGADRARARSGGELRRDLLRPHDPCPVRANSDDVFRYQQPRAGEPGRRARDPRLCAGEARDAIVSRN